MFEKDLHIITPTQTPIGSVIFLHGLGADNRNFDSIVPHISGVLPLRFVFPNAPMRAVSINRSWPARAWYDIYSLTNLHKEDEQGLEDAQRFVESLIESEIKNNIPADRIVLAGFSQGGAVALYTGTRYHKKLAGMMGLSCYLPMFTKPAPLNAAQKHTPIFLAHGCYDSVLPITLAQLSKQALNQCHAQISWHEYPIAHEVSQAEMRDIEKWLADVYKKPEGAC